MVSADAPFPPSLPMLRAYAAAVTAAVLAFLVWGIVQQVEWHMLTAAGHLRWERLLDLLVFAAAGWVYAALVCCCPYAAALAVAQRWGIRHPAYYLGGAMAAALLGNAGLLYLRSVPNDDPTGHVPTLLEWTAQSAPVTLFAGACAGLVAWRVLFPRRARGAEPD